MESESLMFMPLELAVPVAHGSSGGLRTTMTSSQFPFAVIRRDGVVEGDDVSLVPWWSITKLVLAAAVLRLAEIGLVGLDTRFEDWPFTVRQLLKHTSGLATYGGPAYQQAVTNGDPVWSVAELLERSNARRLMFAPGEKWAYSNIGYLFLRQLIEKLNGSSLDKALKTLIFAPLHIEHTKIATGPADLIPTLWGNQANYDPGWVYHGLLIGPPVDAVNLFHRLLDGQAISPASLSMMQNYRLLGGAIAGRPWLTTAYGLGLMMGTMTGAGRAFGHSGVGPDSVSALYAFPDLPDRPIVAVFGRGTNESTVENEALGIALSA